MTTVPCPACGRRGGLSVLTATDHREGLGGAFTIVRCAGCGLSRTDPVPADLDPWYPDTYQQHVAGGVTARVVNRAIRHAAGGGRGTRVVAAVVPDADLGGPISAGIRVLDVGAGNGNAVRALRAAGADAWGVEPDPGGVEAARAQGSTTVLEGTFEGSPLASERWDVVRFFHVVEHLRDPRATLACAREALHADGRLVVGVPNFGGLARRVLGPSWDGLELPRHLIHFNARTLTTLIESAGFSVTGVRTTPLFGVLPRSLDAAAARGRRQRGWGNALPVRAASYPVEVALALAGLGDGLLAVATPRP
ncbi:MAG: class I SAM-dependent methyltransferase [Actinobacteria bacterium]|nr:class I SAM-dependent methyltransferase [Actinomycetota bacterium]